MIKVLKSTSIIIAYLALATIFTLGLNTAASADKLDEARAAGLVGEMPNGYIGLVRKANKSTQDLVKEINLQRRAMYREIAKKNGTSLSAVEGLTGKTLLERVPKGQYY